MTVPPGTSNINLVMKQNYSIYHEGKQLEKELLAYYKKIKEDTKELKKRYRALTKKADKMVEKSNDTDYDEEVYACIRKSGEIVYYKIGGYFENWEQ